MGYSYSAQVVEVSVDEETGVVTVDKVWVAHDCGKALNRLTVEGQVQGSVWMGMGQAMSEEAAYHDGLMVTANMACSGSVFLTSRRSTKRSTLPSESHVMSPSTA